MFKIQNDTCGPSEKTTCLILMPSYLSDQPLRYVIGTELVSSRIVWWWRHPPTTEGGGLSTALPSDRHLEVRLVLYQKIKRHMTCWELRVVVC